MNRDILVALGSRMKQIRLSLGLSQRDFAKPVEISSNYLSDIENGKANPNYDFFLKLGEVYHVNLDFVYFGHGEMFRNPSASNPTLSEMRELIEKGGASTKEQVLWIMEYCPGFNYSVLGFTAQYIFKNKEMLLSAIHREEQKAQAEESKP